MSHVGRVWLVCVLAGWGLAACKDDVHQLDDAHDVPPTQVGAINPKGEDDAGVEDAGADEDEGDQDASRPRQRPTREPTDSETDPDRKPAAGGKDDDTKDGDDNGRDDNGRDDNGDDDNGDDDNGDDDNGDDDKEPAADLPPVAGTAGPAGCYSYTTPSNGMCGSHYCGVTEAQLRAEIPANSVCGDPEFACTGNLVRVSGACARRVKGNMPFASNESLRPAIVSCVNEDREIAERVSAGCMSCFLDALDCVSQACLVECLNGDSPQCDRCGQNAGCFDPVFSCGDLPNPN